jgi:hypothetical protein
MPRSCSHNFRGCDVFRFRYLQAYGGGPIRTLRSLKPNFPPQRREASCVSEQIDDHDPAYVDDDCTLPQPDITYVCIVQIKCYCIPSVACGSATCDRYVLPIRSFSDVVMTSSSEISSPVSIGLSAGGHFLAIHVQGSDINKCIIRELDNWYYRL